MRLVIVTATFISSNLLNYQLTKYNYHKTNLNKTYLVSVFKSQENLLLNQCSNQSDNSLQEAPHKPSQRGTAV